LGSSTDTGETMVQIIVCIKQVYDIGGLKVDPKTRSLVTDRVERKISDFDKNALEEALRIRERQGGSVIAITLGPSTANDALREALNMGADEAYLIDVGDTGEPDARVTADLIAAAIKRIGGFDLIICGEASVDMYAAQVGPRIAERLGIPLVSHARSVSVSGSAVTAERDLEDAYETVEAPIPLLLTVTKEINEPRIPKITMVIKASKKTAKVLHAHELGIPLTPSVKVLKALAPVTERKREVIRGKTEEVTENLARQLLRDGVVGG
jgi:electron transfer flavoprotein beta subunit